MVPSIRVSSSAYIEAAITVDGGFSTQGEPAYEAGEHE
jgi:hypothetical protein